METGSIIKQIAVDAAIKAGAVIKGDTMNVDDGQQDLIDKLTNTLIASGRDPSLIAEITDHEVHALIVAILDAKEAAESKERLSNVEF